MAGVTHETGNAHSSGTPSSTSFARSSLLYWVLSGFVFIFYISGLSNALRRSTNATKPDGFQQ